jgi:ATP-dependent DNA ligase
MPFAILFDSAYIPTMLWRVRNSRGEAKNAPAAFIHPCRPTVAKRPPRGSGWVHELKQDGYRLQIHVREGRVRLYTMNAADWTQRYPVILDEAARIKGTAIFDAEVVCVSDPMGWRTSMRCTAAFRITARSPALLIC